MYIPKFKTTWKKIKNKVSTSKNSEANDIGMENSNSGSMKKIVLPENIVNNSELDFGSVVIEVGKNMDKKSKRENISKLLDNKKLNN